MSDTKKLYTTQEIIKILEEYNNPMVPIRLREAIVQTISIIEDYDLLSETSKASALLSYAEYKNLEDDIIQLKEEKKELSRDNELYCQDVVNITKRVERLEMILKATSGKEKSKVTK